MAGKKKDIDREGSKGNTERKKDKQGREIQKEG
jgi:hypothetical protein